MRGVNSCVRYESIDISAVILAIVFNETSYIISQGTEYFSLDKGTLFAPVNNFACHGMSELPSFIPEFPSNEFHILL